jgi:hypothetical protein
MFKLNTDFSARLAILFYEIENVYVRVDFIMLVQTEIIFTD